MCVVTVTAAPGDSESGDLHETCCVQGEAHTALGILPSRMRAWSTDGPGALRPYLPPMENEHNSSGSHPHVPSSQGFRMSHKEGHG